MTAFQLYFDKDAREHAVIAGLRARGFDVLTTLEADRVGSDDM